MNRYLLAIPVGFFVMFVAASSIAVAMRPLVSPMFGSLVRSDAAGLALGPLLGGYFVVTCALAWLIPRVKCVSVTYRHGAEVGLVVGLAVFLGDHLVTTGWSTLPTKPMLISGCFDSLAVLASGAAMARCFSGDRNL